MVPPHYACIRFHRKSLYSASIEYAHVGIIHFLVAYQGGLIGGVKAVRIFHDEFPGSH